MRLTLRLCKGHNYHRWLKKIWARKKPPIKQAHLVKLPEIVQEKLASRGVEIEDPVETFMTKPREEWTAPDDPRFWKPPSKEETEDGKGEPLLLFLQGKRFLEDIVQAQILTKTYIHEGIPSAVEQLQGHIEIPDRDTQLQRYIMQAQKWDPTEEKLPKRIDFRNLMWKFGAQYGIPKEKSLKMFCSNLLRLCQIEICAKYPNLLFDRHVYPRAPLDAMYDYQDTPVHISTTIEYMLASSEYRLPPFASQEMVDMSTILELPTMHPVLPTIDFTRTHAYEPRNSLGSVDEQKDDRYVHTIICTGMGNWKDKDQQAQNIMFCFASAVAQAKKRYGESVRHLPEPIAVQCASVSETTLNFVFYQLNTLDLSSDAGIKNLAWLDSGYKMFEKFYSQPWLREPEHMNLSLGHYEPEGFEKLMAMLLYGLPGVENS